MRLSEILAAKGSHVYTIGPDATLDDVVQELVRHNIGSLVVCAPQEGEPHPQVLGIITERDILRAHAAHKGPLDQLSVRSTMSTNLATVTPEQGIDEAMQLMTERRVRHLPVVIDGRLYGMISIGDVVKAHHHRLQMENFYMMSYIRGERAELAAMPDSTLLATEAYTHFHATRGTAAGEPPRGDARPQPQ